MGKGGQWYWISLIPIIGGIWLLVLLCTPSEPQDNRFGPAVDEQAAPALLPSAPSSALTADDTTSPTQPLSGSVGLVIIRAWYLLHNDFPAANDVDTLRQSTEAGSIAPHHCAGNGIDIIGRDLCHLCLRDLGGDGQQSGGRL